MPPAAASSSDGSERIGVTLQVSAYDRFASGLIALLILLAFFVVLLFLFLLGTKLNLQNQTVEVELIEELAGGDIVGDGSDVDEPAPDELQDVPDQPLADKLEALTDTISSQQAAFDSFLTETSGAGRGEGDGRLAGQGAGGDITIPREERWRFRFSGSLDEYAKQLDYFGMELGAVGGSNIVDFASGFTGAKPTARTGSPEVENNSGRLNYRIPETERAVRGFTEQLLAKAGIRTTNRILYWFVPKTTENVLAKVELDHAGGRPVKEITRTIFGIKAEANGFKFYVIEQTYQ